jgi:2'-5' RNA ligase
MKWRRTVFGAARVATRRVVQVRPGGTALLIPVPAAAELIEECAESGVDGQGLPPHVTVLYPFARPGALDAPMLANLADLIGTVAPFRFSLGRIERFSGDVVYVAPQPAEPFVALTTAVWQRWPDHAPYGGAFPTIVPHLTVMQGAEPQGWRARIARLLPMQAEATEVLLYGPNHRGPWRRLARFALQGQT